MHAIINVQVVSVWPSESLAGNGSASNDES
jgi:hypothetical protein